jgi:ribonuclease HII
VGLIAYIIWGKGTIIGPVESVQPLRDSIALIEKQRHELESQIISKDKAYDSLKYIKQTVIIRYNDKIKFLYTANPNDLDSIIRAAIK